MCICQMSKSDWTRWNILRNILGNILRNILGNILRNIPFFLFFKLKVKPGQTGLFAVYWKLQSCITFTYSVGFECRSRRRDHIDKHYSVAQVPTNFEQFQFWALIQLRTWSLDHTSKMGSFWTHKTSLITENEDEETDSPLFQLWTTEIFLTSSNWASHKKINSSLNPLTDRF